MTWDEYYLLWKPLALKLNLFGSGNSVELIELLGLPKTFSVDHLMMNTNGPLPEDIRVLLETLNNSPYAETLIKILRIKKGLEG